jgi:hypothetical protein
MKSEIPKSNWTKSDDDVCRVEMSTTDAFDVTTLNEIEMKI